ncbi:hypothetical protein P879_06501 [Paragonimus westermani]|uniref:EF-hand domain-containing protein n=1 Tax=Paragonimus westermani TaxID=34504 RepID=A0A8T0DAT4_9TREM|nr:hypothetical protein P879_06501 [Paragonimus westermani]
MATRRLSMTPGEALRTEGPEGRREEALRADNFLQQFFDPQTRRFHSVTASQFTDVWNHFDKDGNGFIDGDELQMFLCKLVECIVPSEVSKFGLAWDKVEIFDVDIIPKGSECNYFELPYQSVIEFQTSRPFNCEMIAEKSLGSSVFRRLDSIHQTTLPYGFGWGKFLTRTFLTKLILVPSGTQTESSSFEACVTTISSSTL